MRGSHFLYLWLILTLVLGFENYRENKTPDKSIIAWLQNKNIIKKTVSISPEPGKPISLVFGYAGFGIMFLTNLYVFRKRSKFFRGMGHLNNWLNFHIFCGLLGPSLIVFHSNFKVKGWVAISFWAMFVSVGSGVIGRYLYTQISKMKGDYARDAHSIWENVLKYNETQNLKIAPETLEGFKSHALSFAGACDISPNPVFAFLQALWGDVRMLTSSVPAPVEMGDVGKYLFRNYAVSVRRSLTTDNFVKLMGYWHTFHMPFGFLMYFAAAIHVVAAIILGVAT